MSNPPTNPTPPDYEPYPQRATTPVFGVPTEPEPPSATQILPAAVFGSSPEAAQEPAPTAAWPVAPQYRSAPPRLPRPPQRRRTAALPLGSVLVVLASALLGGGIYWLLVSVDVFSAFLGSDSFVNTSALAAFGAGGVLAFVAFIVAVVAVVRARPKTAATLLLLASIALPTAATVGGAYYGAEALKERTAAQAQTYAASVDAAQVDAVIARVEALGVEVPGKQEILGVLRAAKGE
ncbi:hypothetical protein GZ998_03465 [Actinomyces sp. 594]|uniref:hypothetical protein n=1 Tax=Actinomyces sp. 594 TaxID=2057793 RepID=UPI001C563D65|nr:hypothetical protein [Actinomyces sp. 594]MBW3068572.1 hypothetical protein [Actinomyces sp. 594]